MQMCRNCNKVYDGSEYLKCPFCSKEKIDHTRAIVFDKKDGIAKSVPKKAHLYD